MKTEQELKKVIKGTITKYREIIFGVDSPICIKCLNELKQQRVSCERGFYQKLKNDARRKLVWDELLINIAIDGDMMFDMRKGEVLGPEVDYTGRFYANFIILTNHKIICCRAMAFDIRIESGTLSTRSNCDFS